MNSADPTIASLARVGRRLTWTLFAAQSLGSAAFIAAATLASILGAELSGSKALAGIPSAVYMTGTAGAALAWGYLMESLGRRGGLVLGLAIGTFGAALAYGAINAGSFVAFLANAFRWLAPRRLGEARYEFLTPSQAPAREDWTPDRITGRAGGRPACSFSAPTPSSPPAR